MEGVKVRTLGPGVRPVDQVLFETLADLCQEQMAAIGDIGRGVVEETAARQPVSWRIFESSPLRGTDTGRRIIHIDIHGQKYAVRSDLDPQYIAELAVYLDEKMRLARRQMASDDPLRVAIMAALNVADQLFHSRTVSSIKLSRKELLNQLLRGQQKQG